MTNDTIIATAADLDHTDTSDLPVHPAADLFPLLAGEDFALLKADIDQHGLREPIVLHDGAILDGRNRYRACRELNIAPTTVAWDGVGTPETFVISMNLHRRHLTASQRAAIATRHLPNLKAKAKERQRRHAGTAPGKTAETLPEKVSGVSGEARVEAARLLKTNPKYVSDAAQILTEAPEIFVQIEKGETTVPEAKAKLQEQRRVRRVADKSEKPAKNTKSKTKKKRRPERARLLCNKLDSFVTSLRRIVAVPHDEFADLQDYLNRGTLQQFFEAMDDHWQHATQLTDRVAAWLLIRAGLDKMLPPEPTPSATESPVCIETWSPPPWDGDGAENLNLLLEPAWAIADLLGVVDGAAEIMRSAYQEVYTLYAARNDSEDDRLRQSLERITTGFPAPPTSLAEWAVYSSVQQAYIAVAQCRGQHIEALGKGDPDGIAEANRRREGAERRLFSQLVAMAVGRLAREGAAVAQEAAAGAEGA